MTRVGNYTFTKTDAGYVLQDATGRTVGTYATARAANTAAVALVRAAYMAAQR